jgi:hypothetical protein
MFGYTVAFNWQCFFLEMDKECVVKHRKFFISGEDGDLSNVWNKGHDGLVKAAGEAGVNINLDASEKIVVGFNGFYETFDVCVPCVGGSSCGVRGYIFNSTQGVGIVLDSERDLEGGIENIGGSIYYAPSKKKNNLPAELESSLRRYFVSES